MKKEIYERFIQDKVITDCAIISKDEMAFITKEMPKSESDYRPIEDRESCVLLYSTKRWKERDGFGYVSWGSGIEFLKVAYDNLTDEDICCDSIWNGYQTKIKNNKFSPVLPKEKQDDYTRGSEGVVYIDGEAYMYGILRKVFKRVGIHKWIDITDQKIHSNLFDELKKMKDEIGSYKLAQVGFYAMDGFNANDIYAGGEKGDMWHYNGAKWSRVDLPSNFNIHTITCAEDGKVYIAGYTGGVLIGRDSKWKLIENKGGKIFSSSAWFNGILYLSGDSGLHYIDGDMVKKYKFSKNSPSIYSFETGVVSSCKDRLLVCSTQQALIFDGKVWNEIIGNPVLSGNI